MRVVAALVSLSLLFVGCAHSLPKPNQPALIEQIEIIGTVTSIAGGEIVPLEKNPDYPYTTSIVIRAEKPTECAKKEFSFEVFQRRKFDCDLLLGRTVRVRLPMESFERGIRRYYEESIVIEDVAESDRRQ